MLSTPIRRSLSFPLLLSALVLGCSKSSGDSGAAGGGANQAGIVGFDLEIALGSLGVPIAPISPTTNVAASSFSIAPALPAGLALDPATGTIAGTPTALAPRTTYTLTADFGGQPAIETIELEIVPTSRFLFVGTAGANGVADSALVRSSFDAERGELALSGVVPAGSQEQDPNEMVVDPTGRWVYVANAASDSLSIHTLNPKSGVVSAQPPVLLAPGSGPRSLVLDPAGARLYALLRGASRIEVWDIDAQSGSLTPLPAAGEATGAGAETLALDPSGAFLFCANEADGNVSAYSIDGLTGALTEVGQRIATGPFPRGLAAIDTGFLYVTAPTLSQIAILAFDATGALSVVDTVALGGPVPTRLTAHPNGRSLAVLDQTGAEVLTFAIDRTTGALTALGGAVATPTFPRALRYDPSGGWLAVTSFTDGEVALYAVDRMTGALSAESRVAVGLRPFDVLWSLGAGPLTRYADLAFTSDDATRAITTFTVDDATGDLTIELNPPIAGPDPSALELDPTGRFLYASDAQSGTIAMFRLGSGSPWLTALGASPAGQPGLDALAVDPSGRFVAAASTAGNGITSFVIDQGPGAFVEGDLIPAPTPFTATGASPAVLTYGRTGRFLFVGHGGTGPGTRTIDAFAVDSQTGSLGSVPVATATPINGVPTGLAVHPNGRVLYAAIATAAGGSAAAWELAPDGSRTQILPAQSTGELSRGIAVDPRGRFLAIAVGSSTGSGDVAILSIDPTTGGLGTAMRWPAGLQPVALAFDPGGARLYVAGSGGDVARCDVDPSSGMLSVTGSFPSGVSVNGLVLREQQR